MEAVSIDYINNGRFLRYTCKLHLGRILHACTNAAKGSQNKLRDTQLGDHAPEDEVQLDMHEIVHN